jgi:hypothetical protein
MLDALKVAIIGEDKLTAVLNNAQDKLKGLAEETKKLSIASGVAFAGIVAAIGKSIQAYQQEELAQERLKQVIGQTTGATQAQIQALLDQASALQALGVVEDDAIVMGQSQLASFSIQTTAIQKLTPALADLAVGIHGVNVTQEQMQSSADLVGKAMTGQTGALQKLLGTLPKATKEVIENGSEMERAAAIAEILSKKYGGLNEQMAKTSAGAMVKLKNAFSDLLETIGKAFAPSLDKLAEAITTVIQKITAWVDAHPELVKNLGLAAMALFGTVAAIYPTIKAIQLLGAALFLLQANQIVALIIIIGTLVISLGGLKKALIAAGEAAGAFFGWVHERIQDIKGFVAGTDEAGKAVDNFTKSEGVTSGLKVVKANVDNITLSVKDGTEGMKKFGAGFGGAVEDMKSGAADAVKTMEEVKKKHTETMQGFSDEINETKASIQELATAYKIFLKGQYADFGEKYVEQEQRVADIKRQIMEETDAIKIQALKQELSLEENALSEGNALLVRSKEDEINRRISLEQQYNSLKATLLNSETLAQQASIEVQMENLQSQIDYSKNIEEQYSTYQKDLLKGVEQARIATATTEFGRFINDMILKTNARRLDFEDQMRIEAEKLKELQRSRRLEIVEYNNLRTSAISAVEAVKTAHVGALQSATMTTQTEISKQIGMYQTLQAAASAVSLQPAALTLQGGGAIQGKLKVRAEGGAVSAGQPYIVGEKRPELFVPSTNGYIHPTVPNGSVTINVSGVFGSDAANEIGDLIIKRLVLNKAV